jgi:hypothetical protein
MREEQEETHVHPDEEETRGNPEAILDVPSLAEGIFENLVSGLAHRRGDVV